MQSFNRPCSDFVFKEISTGIDESVTRSQFENGSSPKLGKSTIASIACLTVAMSKLPISTRFS